MFPSFVTDFGDQFTAVLINMFGTVISGLISSMFTSIFTTVITPVMKSLAAGVGIM